MITTLEDLYAPVQAELAQVQDAVAAYWGDLLSLIHGPSLTPPKVGGKLLRPALCLLSAGAAGARDISAFADLAIACELLHMGALTHDDVIDRAALRRGATSLNALWDNHAAVLSGDYLVARAIALLTRFNSCELIASTIDAVKRMTEGELASFGRSSEHFTQEDCLRLAEEKTATYFAATCTAPTYLEGASCRQTLHDYGMALGIAFQLTDDVLDIAQNQEALGKPSCGDIVEGKRTLPILLMRELLEPTDRDRLNRMIGSPISDEDRAWAARAMDISGAHAKTEAMAREYADAARVALESLSPSPYRDSMMELTEFVLVRGS